MHETFQEPPFGYAIHLFIPSRWFEGSLSEKISGLKQMTVRSPGEPDALNPGLLIGSLLIHLSCLLLICLLIACPLSPLLPAIVYSCCFREPWQPNVPLTLGELVLPEEIQAPHVLPASAQTLGL